MFFKNLFKKADIEKEDSVHEKRKNAMADLINDFNKLSFTEIQKTAKLQPTNPFFHDIKNKEEFLIRNEIMGLAALMAGDDLGFLERCKELIECADKGLKINPNSAYMLYFRGRSKGDLGNFEEGLKDLNNCLKIKQDYADAYVERGYIRQKMGNFSGAKNDYDKGVRVNPTLQQQVNCYLNKEVSKENMVIPSGITFKFVVNPSLSENHQKGLRTIIIKNSGLDQYFKNIDVTFYDRYKENKVSDDKFSGKQMLVKVFCPEPIVAIEKDKENKFYKQLEVKFSKWIIGAIQNNTEKKYAAKLEDFLFTQQLEF